MVVSCPRCTPPGGVGCATTAGLLARGSTLPAPPSRTFRSSGPPRRRGGRASGSPLTVAGAAADLPPDHGPARAHGVPFSPARAGPTTYKHSFMFWGRASPERRRQGAGRPNSGPVRLFSPHQPMCEDSMRILAMVLLSPATRIRKHAAARSIRWRDRRRTGPCARPGRKPRPPATPPGSWWLSRSRGSIHRTRLVRPGRLPSAAKNALSRLVNRRDPPREHERVG